MKPRKSKTKAKSKSKDMLVMDNSPFNLVYNQKGQVVAELYSYVFDPDEIELEPTVVQGIDLQFDGEPNSSVNASYQDPSLIYYCPREPYGPPAPPPPPPSPPKLTDGPKTAADKKVNKKMGGILGGNRKDPAWREIWRRFWGKVSTAGKIKGVEVPWIRDILKKYKNCDFSTIYFTFYTYGRPYWGEPSFYPTKPVKGYGAKGLSGIAGGTGLAIGELTYYQYQGYGAKAHMLCGGKKWCTVDLGRIGEFLIKTITFKNYERRFFFSQLDTTQDGGSFKKSITKWNKVPSNPSKVPSPPGPGKTDVYY